MSKHPLLTPRYILIVCAAVVLVGLWFLVGNSKQHPVAAANSNSGGPAAGGRPPAPVTVATVEQRDVPLQLTAIGNVEPYQAVQIKSLVNGQIEKVHFQQGQDVRQGQLLFTLDKRPFQAELARAQGAMRRDEAAAANSAAQAARYNELEKQGVIATQQAEQQRAQAQADASAVYADKAAVDAARVQLQYAEIHAPIDARTGAVMPNVGNVGNLVKANDTTYLVQLNQIAPIYVTFSIPESSLEQVRSYANKGKLKVLAYPKNEQQGGAPAEGVLTFVDNGVDTTTGTVKLKATFPNQDHKLWPGEYVNAVLELSVIKNATVVPTKAVQAGQQGDYIYVVTPQDTAESRPVTVSGSYQDLTLLSKGVKPGERIVLNGQLRVAPNAKVVVQNAAASGTSPNAPSPGGGQ